MNTLRHYIDLVESAGRESGAGMAAFDAWFGNSKIVDGNGRPLRVYHGTDSDFSQFERDHVPSLAGPDSEGFYFTPDPAYAAQYGDILMPCYLRMERPFVVPPDGYEHASIPKARRAELEAQGYDGVVYSGNPTEKRPAELVVFRPDQIKSAVGNNGAFDPASHSITESGGREPVDGPSGTISRRVV